MDQRADGQGLGLYGGRGMNIKVGDRVKVGALLPMEELLEGEPDPAERWRGRMGKVFAISTAHFGIGVDFYDGTELWFREGELEEF